MKHLIALFAALTMTACAGNAKHADDTLYYLCDNNEKGKLDFEDEILVITRTPEGEYKGKFYGTSDEFMKAWQKRLSARLLCAFVCLQKG